MFKLKYQIFQFKNLNKVILPYDKHNHYLIHLYKDLYINKNWFMYKLQI